ncbi:MAG: V-type ATP synthase subunit D [Desulfurococcales archaeon]|nr:V-type ATP synthase subunit D [Desulfurococcales archaeon]
MAIDPRKVLPTKINLIKLRREEKMLRKIRGVMEEKREVLLHYIKSAGEEYNRYQNEVFRDIDKLFAYYYLGLAEEGEARARSYAEAVPDSTRVRVGTRILFAVKTPTFQPVRETVPGNPYPPEASPRLRESREMLVRLLPSILKLAEYEEMLRRLIAELRETQRLVNAMDYVILPSYQQAIKFIKSVLDERMREDFVRLKMLKRKLSEREEAEAREAMAI